MNHTERYTSFIIEKSHITSVEIAHSARGYTLTAAGSFDSEIDFDDPVIFEESGMDKRIKIFSGEIQNFMKRTGAGSKYFSFGLNSRMAMLQRIPIEMSLTDEEFNVHLEWELKNYYPDAVMENYILLPFALVDSSGNPGTKAMIIGVRKSLSNFLRSVSKKCFATDHVVDIDHFCAETAIMHNFPQATKERTAVIGIDEESIDCSLLVNGKNSDITIERWSGTSEIKKIAEYAFEHNAEQIFLHGRIVDELTAEQLKQFTPLPVSISDPFKKISLPPTIKNVDAIKAHRQEYTAAVGLALRKD
ncbi:MAG: hypothetical protein H3C35_03480 [Bacteroidetes bacterium]|nr:hypothetical protein [Bacteroidota bacterium]